MNRSSRTLMQRQRGVALIAALLVVALAVVLVAALLDLGDATRARSRNSLRAEQTWQLMHGLEAWAASVLLRDLENGEIDSPDEPWAQPMPPLQIPGGQVFGRLREQGGCFNLNNLSLHDVEQAQSQELALNRFERLLATLRLDPAIATQARDWIDEDSQPGPGGAEDLHYLQRRPAYRSANRPFVHVSELRLLAGVDDETYRRLHPHVCALPAGAATNLNFASPQLWMSIDPAITESAARRLSADGQARYASVDDIQTLVEEITRTPFDKPSYSVVSEYFIAEADIVVDGIPYAYASLLQRSGSEVRVLQRTRGRL